MKSPLALAAFVGGAGALMWLLHKEEQTIGRGFRMWLGQQEGTPSKEDAWRGAIKWQSERAHVRKDRRLARAGEKLYERAIKETAAHITEQMPELPPAAVGIAAASINRRAFGELHEALNPPKESE